MVLAESEQHEWKGRILGDTLERIGRIETPARQKIIPAPASLGYRNKVEFSLGRAASGQKVLGLHSATEPGTLIDVPACAVQHDQANAVLGTAREFLLGSADDPAPSGSGAAEPRLVIRRSWATAELLLVLRTSGPPMPGARELADFVSRRHPETSGVVQVTAKPGRRGGARSEALSGRTWIEERLAGHRFKLPASTFLQINTEAARNLVRLVTKLAGPITGCAVLDLYGGVGTYTFSLVRSGAARAVVCDADAEAIECGRSAAREAKLDCIEFRHADAGPFLAAQDARKGRFDVVIANPPRTGLGRGVAKGIVELRAERVILVSCDPATLARDLRALVHGGYTLSQVTPVDMFPQTAHIEAVALLTR
jgi:23S rRNA (uracil1939-C5)-methyltransferase